MIELGFFIRQNKYNIFIRLKISNNKKCEINDTKKMKIYFEKVNYNENILSMKEVLLILEELWNAWILKYSKDLLILVDCEKLKVDCQHSTLSSEENLLV